MEKSWEDGQPGRLNLKVKFNQDKSQVAPTNQINFLGFTFSRIRIRWPDKAFREFKHKMKQLISSHKPKRLLASGPNIGDPERHD